VLRSFVGIDFVAETKMIPWYWPRLGTPDAIVSLEVLQAQELLMSLMKRTTSLLKGRYPTRCYADPWVRKAAQMLSPKILARCFHFPASISDCHKSQ
jgi:hypothetical protein